jgi:tetratricopeptide (TPR) repeat protein
MGPALEVYEASVGACEVPGWRDQRVFLQLLQERAHTEDDIGLLLGHFRDQSDARKYLARHLLRRVVDPRLVAAIENALFGNDVDWWLVDRELALAIEDEDRLAILTKALARAPGDPQGERRMIDLLAKMGRVDEALARGHRLRDQGLITPELAQQLGEILADAERPDEAKRLFSEIVEFDPTSARSRGMLGDIFFRHGWFEDAYRQYEDLVEMTAENHLAAIRLARAAAGAERTDEALRLLRKVASGEGRPGANDPRRWARLHAAVLLGGLLDGGQAPKESLERELKRLQLFEGPKKWVVLVWNDHSARLVAAPAMPKASERGPEAQRARQEATALLANAIDATPTALFALEVPVGQSPELTVRHRGFVPDHDVAYRLVTLEFDGSHFTVTRKDGVIPALKASEDEEEARASEPKPEGDGDGGDDGGDGSDAP